jgi:hypothetical protein
MCCAQIGNLLFSGRVRYGKVGEEDLKNYSLEADADETVPMPPPPKDGNVQGKPRDFLPYAPSWAKQPDFDRVCSLRVKTISK